MKKFYAGMILAGMMAAALAITGCPSPTGGQTTYSISLDQTGDYAFSEATLGYGAQTEKTVTVRNTGNQATGTLTIEKSGANPGSFTVSKASLNSIAAGGNDSFTVVPAAALAAGTYTATITVSGGNSISASLNLSFTVTATAYGIGLSQTGTYAFPGAAPGYDAPNALTITVNNTGTQATGALTIAMSGADPGSFTVSKASLNSIAAGGNDSFTVVPVTGLAAETYAATITVSGGNGISAGFNVSFAVTVPVDYGIALSEIGTYAFLGAVPGYEAQSPQTVTVNNIGTNATGALTIAKSGAEPGSFAVSTNSLNSIAAGGNDSFTVVPVTGLAEGTYTATITVSGENEITAGFNVSFTVDAAAEENAVDIAIGIADEHIDLTKSTENDLSQELGKFLQLTAPEGYTSYAWYVDMDPGGYNTISDRIIEIPAYWHSYGTHSVLLQYEKDGIPYGCEVLFRVVR
jgi:uncharacterized membrane protein